MSAEVLVNSKEYDRLFNELTDYLESCSQSSGGCESCPLKQDCTKAFDIIMDTRTHYKITQSDLDGFKAKYNRMAKQLILV